MHVLKFGGTSMVDAKSWRRVLNIIAQSEKPVVVVSATDRTTRHLAAVAQTALTNLDAALKAGNEISARHQKIVTRFLEANPSEHKDKREQQGLNWIQECSSTLFKLLEKINNDGVVLPQYEDAVLSIGEQLSARLFALCGQAFGLSTNWVDARLIIKTDQNFGNAKPDVTEIEKHIGLIEEKVNRRIIPVIGGFYGENEKGQITTLGFEGSDYTASLIGSALNAEAVEIWTDVSGIYSCDPRTIPAAQPIEKLSFNDAEQLANHGAKVLHPASVHPAASKNIPVLVKNIFRPEHSGTTISSSTDDTGFCKAIAFVENVIVFKINTTNQSIRDHRLVEVYSILDSYEPEIIAIKTEKKSTIAVLNKTARAQQLEDELAAVTAVRKIQNQSLVGLIGCTLPEPELLERINRIFEYKQLLLIYNEDAKVLNLLINKDDLLKTVQALHADIFE